MNVTCLFTRDAMPDGLLLSVMLLLAYNSFMTIMLDFCLLNGYYFQSFAEQDKNQGGVMFRRDGLAVLAFWVALLGQADGPDDVGCDG